MWGERPQLASAYGLQNSEVPLVGEMDTLRDVGRAPATGIGTKIWRTVSDDTVVGLEGTLNQSGSTILAGVPTAVLSYMSSSQILR